jgi:SAM-dependent methyltransferase
VSLVPGYDRRSLQYTGLTPGRSSEAALEPLQAVDLELHSHVTPPLSELYMAFDSAPTRIVAFLQRLAEEYHVTRPPRVLDVGCGPGRLLRPLERLHWDVTGMEPNPNFLASARAIAQESRRLRARPGGFEDIEDANAFDLVLGVNSSFAHLIRPEERADALRRVYRALRPRGVVLLDLPNFLWILRHYQPPRSFSSTLHGRAVTLRRRHDLDYHDATLTTTDRYVFEDGSPSVELVHVYGMSTPVELTDSLSKAGFTRIHTYDSYDSQAPERLSGARMLLAAQRPAA